MEHWKPVHNYENAYHVSDKGRIKSLRKLRRRSEKILKPLIQRYASIELGDGTNIKRYLIHRLVAIAFIPNIENKPQVNHINGIKTDNRVENLEWATRSENQKHSIRIGLRTAKGENNSQSKLCIGDVFRIRELSAKGFDNSYLSDIFNVSQSTICDIKYNRSWKHI